MLQGAIKEIAGDDQFDLLLIHLPLSFINRAGREVVDTYVAAITNLAAEINRRTAVVLHVVTSIQDREIAQGVETVLHRAGFPVYPSVGRAASAISRFIRYHQ